MIVYTYSEARQKVAAVLDQVLEQGDVVSLAEQVGSPWGDDCITISGPGNAEARAWYAGNQMAVLSW